MKFFLSILEILHRLLDSRDASRAVHAGGEGRLQVPALEDRRVHRLRVLHHDPHRPQHNFAHDESKIS